MLALLVPANGERLGAIMEQTLMVMHRKLDAQ